MNYRRSFGIPIVYAANHLGLLDAYSFLRRSLLKSRVAILFYHRVGEPAKYPWCLPPTGTRDFENQISYMCQKYEVMPLDKVARYLQESKPLPKKAVVITFDDGYKDNYLNAYPILKKYSVPATIFLATGPIDSGELFWFNKVGYVIYYTALEALELDELGRISCPLLTSDYRRFIRLRKSLRNYRRRRKTHWLRDL